MKSKSSLILRRSGLSKTLGDTLETNLILSLQTMLLLYSITQINIDHFTRLMSMLIM